jgi:hypothetical protein
LKFLLESLESLESLLESLLEYLEYLEYLESGIRNQESLEMAENQSDPGKS